MKVGRFIFEALPQHLAIIRERGTRFLDLIELARIKEEAKISSQIMPLLLPGRLGNFEEDFCASPDCAAAQK
jgi:hypothetical protein